MPRPDAPRLSHRLSRWSWMVVLLGLLSWGVWSEVRREHHDGNPEEDASRTQIVQGPSVAIPTSPKLVPVAAEVPTPRNRHEEEVPMEMEETLLDTDQGTVIRQTKLIRVDEEKYPLLRVEEDWFEDETGGRELRRQRAMVADHLLIKPKNPEGDEALLLESLRPLKASIRRRMPASGIWIIAVEDPDLNTLSTALEIIAEKPDLFQYGEPDYIVYTQLSPNDPAFPSLWGLDNQGQDGGTPDADIDAPEAWDLETGSRAVVVGVIDTGIDLTHPALAANLWVNPGEIADNGVDDDGNGYIDDVHGWDFANDDADPTDDHDHGTHVAGTIGAVGNDGEGVVGVCWEVSLAALKFLSASGSGATSDATEAIAYATRMGFDLTCNSWGGSGYSQSLKDAIDAADTAGILTVCAAGNEATNNDQVAHYPSNYTSPNVISVAALTRSDQLASFSNYGAQSVDLAAPGAEILSSVVGGGYASFSGTSMATPHVAGACALLKSSRPGLTHHEIRDLFFDTTIPIPALQDRCRTGGRLNVHEALLAASGLLVSWSGDRLEVPLGGPFDGATLEFELNNYADTAVDWQVSSAAPWLSFSLESGALAPDSAQTVVVTVNDSAQFLDGGLHPAEVEIREPASGRRVARTLMLTVLPPVVYEDSLETDPGWPRGGEWDHGVPTGGGGLFYGGPDPSSAATGSQVFGIRLSGDYSTLPTGKQSLVLGPVDLSRHRQGLLEFRRWLNTDYQPWVTATVEISIDGTQWTEIWNNGTAAIEEADWSLQRLDLGPVADGAKTVWLRWTHEVGSVEAFPYSGWNIDDVRIRATPEARLLWEGLPTALREGDASVNVRLRIEPPPQSDLTVAFSSSAPFELQLPADLIVAAGQSEIPVSLTALDDLLLDGSQTREIRATASGYFDAEAQLVVHDNESTALTVLAPATFQEGSGVQPNAIEIRLGQAAERRLEVQLQSSDPGELQIPSAVLVEPGEDRVQIHATLPEDAIIDGVQSVVLSASVESWTSGEATTEVEDNESREMQLTLSPWIGEGTPGLSAEGEVRLDGDLVEELEITLLSNAPSRVSHPATVRIPAGEDRVGFTVVPTDNGLTEGTIPVLFSVTAPGFLSDQATTLLFDDELPGPAVNPLPADLSQQVHPDSDLSWEFLPGLGATPDSVEVFLGEGPGLDASDRVFSGSEQVVILDRLTPGTTYYWRVDTLLGVTRLEGETWSFTVPPVGPVHHFAWTSIASPQWVSTPFSATLTALDEFDNPVTDYQGPAQLVPPESRKIVITEIQPGTPDSIELTNVSADPVDLAGWRLIPYDNFGFEEPAPPFVFPAGSVLPPGASLLVEEYGTPPGTHPNYFLGYNIDWTDASFSWVGVLLLDDSSQTVDFVAAGGVNPAIITDPISIGTDLWNGPNAGPILTNETYQRRGSRDYDLASDWHSAPPSPGQTNTDLDLPFPLAAEAPFDPAMFSGFVNGAWTGTLTPSATGFHSLVAEDENGITGESDRFEVQSLGAVILSLPAPFSLTEGDGVLAGAIELELPLPAASNLTVTITSTDSTELADGTATLLAGEDQLLLPVEVLDDPEIDGPQEVALIVAVPGYDPGSVTLSVRDNEISTLTVELPVEMTEGQSPVVNGGRVSLSQTVTSPIEIDLSSSDETELLVPAVVTIPPGSDHVDFEVRPLDDGLLDGTQRVTVTASVEGWPEGHAETDIRDDEVPSLALLLPVQVTEGDGVLPGIAQVVLGGILVEDETLTLSSADVTEIGVPSSVVVRAGQDRASFWLNVADDPEPDGEQSVQVSAQGLSLATTSGAIRVRDNDPASMTLSVIPSPQFDHLGFLITVEALDLNGEPLPAVQQGITVRAQASDGSPLPVDPPQLPLFSGHRYEGVVQVGQPGLGVVLSLATPHASVQSNAFDVLTGPRMDVDPGSLSVTVPQGSIAERLLEVRNTGLAALDWIAQTETQVTAAGRDEPVDPRTASRPQPAPLEDVLAILNGNVTTLTDLIPHRHDFQGGESSDRIQDGGNDMYDNGNLLRTDRSPENSYLPYVDNRVTADTIHLNGRYFTRKHPGLFVFAADLDGPVQFEIAGNLGADGGGQQTTLRLTSQRSDGVWTGFAKRVSGAGDASVNHLIITQDSPALAQTIGPTTDSDLHRVEGLEGPTRIYHLLFSSVAGHPVPDTAVMALFEAFLDLSYQANWLATTESTGTIGSGDIGQITVRMDARGLPIGPYLGTVELTSNDPTRTSALRIPVTLNVTASVDRFHLSAIPQELLDGERVSLTIEALRQDDSRESGFNGQLHLQLEEDLPSEIETGSGSQASSVPLQTSRRHGRTQAIYLPSELGPARRITSIGFQVLQVPDRALTNVVLRLRHTLLEDYGTATPSSWIGSGWSTVFSGDLDINETGTFHIPLERAFNYDGSRALMIDLSFGGNLPGQDGQVSARSISGRRVLSRSIDDDLGAPPSWSGASPTPSLHFLLPDLILTGPRLFEAFPGTIPLIDGLWSGDWLPLQPHPSLRLVARLGGLPDGSPTGAEGTFNVRSIVAPQLEPEPPFTQGLANAVGWSNALPGEYRLQYATQPDFSDALETPWSSGGEAVLSELIDGTTYHYRAQRREPRPNPEASVSPFRFSAWSPTVQSTQDASPPRILSPFRDGGSHSTTRDVLTLSGRADDLSGIQSLTFDGAPTTTSNGYQTWSYPLTPATTPTAHTLTATDRAADLPNTTSLNFTLQKVQDDDADHLPSTWETLNQLNPSSNAGVHGALGDLDLDGIRNLLEFAFGLRADHPDPSPCSCRRVEVNGEGYLEFRYPRRIDSIDLEYRIVISSTPGGPPAASYPWRETSVVRDLGGQIEMVTVHLGPLRSVPSLGFVRVEVETRP